MTLTPDQPPHKPQSWNALGLIAAVIVAFSFFWSLILVAMPRWYHRTVFIATIVLLAWLINRSFLQPMLEQMREESSRKDKNAE